MELTLDKRYSILMPVSEKEKSGVREGIIDVLFRPSKPDCTRFGFPIILYLSHKGEVFAQAKLTFLSPSPYKADIVRGGFDTEESFIRYCKSHSKCTIYGWYLEDTKPVSLRNSEFLKLHCRGVGRLTNWTYTLNPLY